MTKLLSDTVADTPGTRKLYLRLTKEGKIQGFGGTRTFTGTYKLGPNNALTFSPSPAAKRTEAFETIALQMKFLNVLAKTTRYRLEEDNVLFLGGDRIIARFQKRTSQ